jgi:hypothetical protein
MSEPEKIDKWVEGLAERGFFVPSGAEDEAYSPAKPGLDATGAWACEELEEHLRRMGLEKRDIDRAMRPAGRKRRRKGGACPFSISSKTKYFPLTVLRLAGVFQEFEDLDAAETGVWEAVVGVAEKAEAGPFRDRIRKRGGVDLVLDCSSLQSVNVRMLAELAMNEGFWNEVLEQITHPGVRMAVLLLPPVRQKPWLRCLADALTSRFLWAENSPLNEQNFSVAESRLEVDRALETRGRTGPSPAPPSYAPPTNIYGRIYGRIRVT